MSEKSTKRVRVVRKSENESVRITEYLDAQGECHHARVYGVKFIDATSQKPSGDLTPPDQRAGRAL